MTQSDYNQLLQNSFDRELNERELDQIYDFLLKNPNELADFEAVDQLLAKLPDVNVSHNFTSLVINEARCEINNLEKSDKIVDLSWSRFFTSKYQSIRLAGAASFILFIGLLVYQSKLSQDRLNMAESVQVVANFAEMAPELLSDFETINAIDYSDPIDEELWAALK